MFGYVIANREALTAEQRERYKAYYCGVCRALTKNYGPLSGGILSYDMAFLVLVLTSLYEPETREGSERCKPHPLQEHKYLENIFTAYAADLSILLAYHKAADDWRDEKKLSAKALMSALRKPYESASAKLPRQTAAIEKCMDGLSKLEDMNVCDPDAAAKCFGELMRELFVWREDNWAPTLGAMGDALGQFVYVLDAFVDLKSDLKHGRYNPLSDMRRRGSTDEDLKAVLTMLIGECAVNFERLPLIDDIDIMRNIIYSGVWTKFPLGAGKTKDKGGESGNDK